jgi:hypothetical protein
MASRKSGQIWRWIGIAICVLAILPINDELLTAAKAHRSSDMPLLMLGILFLIAYGMTLLFKKTKLAWVFFCCCAFYFCVHNLWTEGIFARSWWINFEIAALFGILAMLIRSAIECFILLQGYWGLLDLEAAQEKAVVETNCLTDDDE